MVRIVCFMASDVFFSSGLRRASNDPDPFEEGEELAGDLASMTKEQRQYLLWYYRTEDCEYLCGSRFLEFKN